MDVINSFPGYEFVQFKDGTWHNMYRGTDLGFGGYVYSEPGMWGNVASLDASSMHPTSIELLNKLGKYTKTYADLRRARVYIKHRDYASAGELFDGKLKPYLTDDDKADELSKALKLPLNSFYGISFSRYENPARDSRDLNNIIALRGALFMRTLQDEITSRGFKVIHIKTDGIKVPDATPEIIKFIIDFGKKYGYEMEHEATYERMCLVNDAFYIAKYDEYGVRNKGGKNANEWTATGAQFQVPYVFKTLFTKEPVTFEDMCETKAVSKGELYLDMNEGLPDVSVDEKEYNRTLSKLADINPDSPKYQEDLAYLERLSNKIAKGHNYIFVGRVGSFCPIKEGCGGGVLYRKQDGKYYAAAGTKGYRWLESETVKTLGKEDCIDEDYYRTLVTEAAQTIVAYGDLNWFTSDKPYIPPKFENSHPVYPDGIPFMNEPEKLEE